MRWMARLITLYLLYDIFLHRLPYARFSIDDGGPHVHVLGARVLAKCGDILLCRGRTIDSASVSAWSCAYYSHVAVVGPDLYVYDITPVEHMRRMPLDTYVREYEGTVYWRRIKKSHEEWRDVGALEFRETMLPLLLSTLSETRPINALTNFAETWYDPGRAYCSEYICRVMGLEAAGVSHPRNFAPGGKYDALYEPDILRLRV